MSTSGNSKRSLANGGVSDQAAEACFSLFATSRASASFNLSILFSPRRSISALHFFKNLRYRARRSNQLAIAAIAWASCAASLRAYYSFTSNLFFALFKASQSLITSILTSHFFPKRAHLAYQIESEVFDIMHIFSVFLYKKQSIISIPKDSILREKANYS